MSTKTRFTGLITTGIVLGLATIGLTSVSAQADSMSDYDNVLQSVSISVDSSGTIQSVSDRSVGLSADGKNIKGDTEKRDFNPEEVASELPVRVSVYYRGDWGEGFDLSEIAGHSGQVEVTLWVQNLTTSAEKLTPNVGGVSSPRSVLVSAPLTVIASTHLPETVRVLSKENLLASGDISEEAVDSNDVRNTGTNGVILREEDGTTLQWASLLASPYTPGLASFSVVMTGDNLPVPEFNVAVQKGFLTQSDPSDFVASSFSSTDTDTETLVYQAVELSSRLADILERTESMISDTRTALNNSQSTIGQTTINDLQNSSQSLVSSTQSMQRDLSQLNMNISKSMNDNGSSTLQQLSTVTKNMQAVLGKESDFYNATTQSEADVKECKALEINLSSESSLSQTLSEVSASLETYSQATDACRKTVAKDFLKVLGPENPDESTCRDNHGTLSCTVNDLRSTATAITDTYRARYEDSNTENPISKIQTPNSSNTYGAALDKLECSSLKLQKIFDPKNESINSSLSLCTGVNALTSVYNDIAEDTYPAKRISDAQTTIQNMRNTLNTLKDIYNKNLEMKNDVEFARGQLCKLYTDMYAVFEDGAHTNAKDDLQNVLETLDGYTLNKCLGIPSTITHQNDSLTDKLTEQRGYVTDLFTLGRGRATYDSRSGEINEITWSDIEKIDNQLTHIERSLSDFSTVTNDMGDFSKEGTQFFELKEQTEALSTLIDEAKGQASLGVRTDLEEIHQRIENTEFAANNLLSSRTNLGKDADELLYNVAKNMSQSSTNVTENGKTIVSTRTKDLDDNYDALYDDSKDAIKESLQQIEASFGESSANAQEVTNQLEADIARVLADIGTPGERSGLLGMLSDATGRANAAGAQIGVAGQATSSFNSVQRAYNYGQQIRREQLRAGINKQKNMKAFMRDLPSSTRHTVTYSFTVSK